MLKYLRYLRDLTELATNKLDYTEDNVVYTDHTETQRAELISILQKHEGIIISIVNALPSPAYGLVCDTDVQGHDLIRQRTRRIPLRQQSRLYELLK